MKFTKSYSKPGSFLTGFVAVSVAISLFASCTEGTGRGDSLMKDDPVGTYREFLAEIRGLGNLSTEELAGHINRWRSIKDSVFNYASQDTTSNPHSGLYGKCEQLHDSLRSEFSRLAMSGRRTYQDILVLKERTSPYYGDEDLLEAVNNARPFFNSLDSLTPVESDRGRILSEYRQLLDATAHDGIHGLPDLQSFIAKEDAVFRTFLVHLNSFEGEKLSDITHNTEQCCSLVFLAAEKKEISYKDAMIYMAMRTNRRIIQNVASCLNDIREDKVKTKPQAWGYACMMLQPYISMDGICMALLSARERDELWKIAEQTPAAFAKLGDVLQSDKERLAELPGMLMEMFIRTI